MLLLLSRKRKRRGESSCSVYSGVEEEKINKKTTQNSSIQVVKGCGRVEEASHETVIYKSFKYLMMLFSLIYSEPNKNGRSLLRSCTKLFFSAVKNIRRALGG